MPLCWPLLVTNNPIKQIDPLESMGLWQIFLWITLLRITLILSPISACGSCNRENILTGKYLWLQLPIKHGIRNIILYFKYLQTASKACLPTLSSGITKFQMFLVLNGHRLVILLDFSFRLKAFQNQRYFKLVVALWLQDASCSTILISWLQLHLQQCYQTAVLLYSPAMGNYHSSFLYWCTFANRK